VSVVLDSSATLAWIFGDETTEAIRRVFDAVGHQGAFVPSIWRLEIGNCLTMAMRRQRSTTSFDGRRWPISVNSTSSSTV
jgi:hypothetical protein